MKRYQECVQNARSLLESHLLKAAERDRLFQEVIRYEYYNLRYIYSKLMKEKNKKRACTRVYQQLEIMDLNDPDIFNQAYEFFRLYLRRR